MLRLLFQLPPLWHLGLGVSLVLTLWAFLGVSPSKTFGLIGWMVLWGGIYWMVKRAVDPES